MEKLNKKILVTGGGSGGHVSPAVAIISRLEKQFENFGENVMYVGGKLVSESVLNGESVEEKVFKNNKVKKIFIRAGKLQRVFKISSLRLLGGVFGGFIDSWKVISSFKPDLIFSTGGYVSVPVCIAGWMKKVPIYIHEQTAGVGLSNRIVGKIAKKIFISFPQSEKYFNSKKTVLTGNIVRESIFSYDEKSQIALQIKKMLSIKKDTGRSIVYISGGGQGSHFINLLVRQMLVYALMDFQIILQTGDNDKFKDYDVLLKDKMKLSSKYADSFVPVKYVHEKEIGAVFKNADIYVGRAGANYLYEMGIFQKPSILIPIPWVTNDEQNKNAKVLVDCGIGKIIPQGELTAEKLHQEIKKFIADLKDGKYIKNEQMLEATFKKTALEEIVRELVKNL